MKNLYISAYARSNVGKLRGNNEDNFYLSGITVDSADDISAEQKRTPELLTAVFDGMGGEAAGEKASQTAALAFADKYKDIIDSQATCDAFESAIEYVNFSVCREIQKLGKRMGSTLVSLGFMNNKIYIANLGDSRAYLLRDNVLRCVTEDHTVAQSMVDAGIISYEESQKIREKHMLTQHLGVFPEEMLIEPYLKSFDACENDVLLLCSDGLTDMLTDDEISGILQAENYPEAAANALVKKALENGGRDNVTVVAAKISD